MPRRRRSRCAISCIDLIQMEEQNIWQEMISVKVICVQRITRNEGCRKVNTPALNLTFCKTTYPEYLEVSLLRVPTCPYFPNPMLCHGCFSYSHTLVQCTGPQRCVNCLLNFHGKNCGWASLCRNCKSDHRSTSRQYPVYKKKVETIKEKVSENLSSPKQKNEWCNSQVTTQQSVLEKRLKELEAAMLAKDKEIAKLKEKSILKDEI